MAFLGQEEQIREFQERFKFLYFTVFIGLGLLIARLVYLQVLTGDKMRLYSEENRFKRVKIASPRGMLFDRKHRLLIDNRPAFDLEIIPQYLSESKQSKEVISLLSRIIQMPEAKIYEILAKAKNQPSFMPVKIKTDLSRDEVAVVESWRLDMPGVQVQEEIKRTNIYGDVASHLLGYIGEVNSTELPTLNKAGQRYALGDVIGKFGLEKELESTLRGVDGEKIVEVDALGRIKIGKEKSRVIDTHQEKLPVPGKNLILTIDQDLQLAAVEAFKDKIGSLVAVDPRNGEILAMISRPSFDPTEFSRGISPALWQKLLANENHPLRDKTLQDHYSPGSTFKVVTAIAGLEEGVIDERTTFKCTGSMRVGNRIYHCHSKRGHGDVNVVSALAQSCDVFFYRTAQALKSVDTIAMWAKHLGLAKKTGVNLAREVPGLMPTEEWKLRRFGQPWSAGETLLVGIGQSFVLTTGLQLANLYASIANGGTLYRPYLVKEIESYEGKVLKEFKPEVLDQTRLQPKTYQLIKQGLWGVVNNPTGTSYHQRLPGMDFVGKSGTVQVVRLSADKVYQKCDTMKFRDRHNAVFAGFAPAKDPVIAVAAIVEHGCGGSIAAAPIVRAVIKKYLETYYPDIYGEKILAARFKDQLKVPKIPKHTDDSDVVQVEEEDAAIKMRREQKPVAPLAPNLIGIEPGTVPKPAGADSESDSREEEE
ncbi:penicillin-binding protein 2 [bacterium]|jgi:penicillin-binding protein 2|nr:penicillin-binding protein 2 [bacterium]